MKLDRLDFVRATYWIAAFVDIGAAVQLLMPVGSSVLGFPGMRAPGAAGRPAVIAAVLMVGWSAVLIWAHLRTRERRTALALTLAVVVALIVVNVAFGLLGEVPWLQLVPALAIQAVLSLLLVTSAAIARQAAIERGVA